MNASVYHYEIALMKTNLIINFLIIIKYTIIKTLMINHQLQIMNVNENEKKKNGFFRNSISLFCAQVFNISRE